MCVLSFDDGMVVESWYAEFALRIRVRKSAIGSVIVMSGGASLAAVPLALGHGGLGAGPLGDQWCFGEGWDLPAAGAAGSSVTRRTCSRRGAPRRAPSPAGKSGTGRTSGRR